MTQLIFLIGRTAAHSNVDEWGDPVDVRPKRDDSADGDESPSGLHIGPAPSLPADK